MSTSFSYFIKRISSYLEEENSNSWDEILQAALAPVQLQNHGKASKGQSMLQSRLLYNLFSRLRACEDLDLRIACSFNPVPEGFQKKFIIEVELTGRNVLAGDS
jgi:hypothetical protein